MLFGKMDTHEGGVNGNDYEEDCFICIRYHKSQYKKKYTGQRQQSLGYISFS